jgi:hypothetical protein
MPSQYAGHVQSRPLGRSLGRAQSFLALVSGGYATARAIFDQPIVFSFKRLHGGRSRAAANMALDYPEQYHYFFTRS